MPDFDTLLGDQGPLAGALEGFRARPAQQQMASPHRRRITGRDSICWLRPVPVPARSTPTWCPRCCRALRVLISTGTRTLQDQLYHRDLPLLAGALGRPAQVKLLKGRSNYLCRARFADIGRQEELLTASTDPVIARLREWSLATRSGDLAEVPELADTHPLRPQLTSTRENCTGLALQ